MKKIRIGLYVITVLLILSLIIMTYGFFEVETIRDVFISPILIVTIYLILIVKKIKMKKINTLEKSSIIGGVSCLGRGMAAPVMVIFSGFISSYFS